MASKYWIKLYHEILDDPKMGMMPDRLFRRTIELFLVAGENDNEGELPSPPEIAWRLRTNAEQLETEMIELQKVGILSVVDGRWIVTKFADRQAAVTDAERMRRYRDRKQSRQYYAPVTNDVTYRNVDTDIDKDREEGAISSAAGTRNFISAAEAERIFQDVTGMPSIPGIDRGQVIDKICSLTAVHGDAITEYLINYWQAWTKSKSKNGRPYSKTNPGWLDWAIAGELPQESAGVLRVTPGQER